MKSKLADLISAASRGTPLTDGEIAAKYGFSRQSLFLWRSGHLPRPSMHYKIADFLGITEKSVAQLASGLELNEERTTTEEDGAMTQRYEDEGLNPSPIEASEKLPERLLKLKEVRAITSLGTSTIYRNMRAGTFPRPLILSEACVRWRESEIMQWIDSRPRA